jgi:glycosyltransferase involved in cell wall biosynthesis
MAVSAPPGAKFGVIVPTYNESRLALLLRRFDFSVTPHVIVVDDGSTDGSTAVGSQYPVTLLRHERRTGVGAAIRTGLRNSTDVTNGFRAYRLALLDDPRIDLSQAWLDRYELEYYLHYKVLSLGYRYAEVPVSKRYPADGLPTSKIRLSRDYWSLLRPLVLLTLHVRK